MPPHIEVESHHHHDDWRRPQQSSSSNVGGGGSGRVEDSSPLFRDHLDDRTFLPGLMPSSCRLDRRVCNPNYSEGKEAYELKEDATADSRQQEQQQQQPSTKSQHPPAKVVSRIAAIIGPESAYYAKACPNNEEGILGKPSLAASSSPLATVVPTQVPASPLVAYAKSGKPTQPPASPSSTSTSSSSSSSTSTCCNEKAKGKRSKKSIFSRLIKYTSWRATNNATENGKVSPSRQQGRNVI